MISESEKRWDASKVKKNVPLTKGQEAFIILRELSANRGGMFRWYQFRDAFKAVSTPPRNVKRSSVYFSETWKMTFGNLLRGCLAAGLIVKVEARLYKITHLGMGSDLLDIRMYRGTDKVRSFNYVKNAHKNVSWAPMFGHALAVDELKKSRTF